MLDNSFYEIKFPGYATNMVSKNKSDVRMIGYARVSTEDQDLALQIAALEKHGVDSIVTDKASGATMKRKGLEKVLNALREGDVLVIWKLDRLGRTVSGVLDVIEKIEATGVQLKVLTESIDTTTPWGRMVMTILLALAQMERELTSQRTKAGIEAKRRAGKQHGRGHSIKSHDKRIAAMQPFIDDGTVWDMEPAEALRILNRADRKAAPIKAHATFSRWRATLPGYPDGQGR